MKQRFVTSILMKVSALITALCLIIMAYSAHQLYRGWTSYRQASELHIVQDAAERFSTGLKNFMFERGRMNVVLSKEEPISPKNRSFLLERRSIADDSFAAGFSFMEEYYPLEAQMLRQEYETIQVLRNQIDAEAAKPLFERGLHTRELWFNSCSDYIAKVIGKVNVIRQLSDSNSKVFNYFDVVIGSLYFRSIVGHQSSIITSAIGGEGAINQEENARLLFLRGEEAQIWAFLENSVELVELESLNAVLANVRELYYVQFRPEQERIIALAAGNQLYEGADKELADLSVPALDAILHLSDEAANTIEMENQRNIEAEFMRFVAGFFQFFLSLFIVIFVPIFFGRKFVQPLNDIIRSLNDIQEGKMDNQILHTQREDEIGKLAHGADMLKGSMLEEQVLRRELEETVSKLEALSNEDSLTGLYNRRYMARRFEELAKLHERSDQPFSVIMGDIDHFKSYNDQYGHDYGDKILTEITAQLSEHCRESDVLARWGGEEFLFLLPDTTREGAKILAERIRAGLAGATHVSNLFNFSVTMTFGVAEYSELDGIDGTIRKADLALLRGKASGRNQVVVG